MASIDSPTISGVGGPFFAVHSYPGRTIQDLSAVRVQAHFVAKYAYTIGGTVYDTSGTTAYVHAGSVAVYCGQQPGAMTIDSVDFILPQ